jgi:hypothetical protein
MKAHRNLLFPFLYGKLAVQKLLEAKTSVRHRMYTMFTWCVHDVQVLFTRRVHSVYTTFTLPTH